MAEIDLGAYSINAKTAYALRRGHTYKGYHGSTRPARKHSCVRDILMLSCQLRHRILLSLQVGANIILPL